MRKVFWLLVIMYTCLCLHNNMSHAVVGDEYQIKNGHAVINVKVMCLEKTVWLVSVMRTRLDGQISLSMEQVMAQSKSELRMHPLRCEDRYGTLK